MSGGTPVLVALVALSAAACEGAYGIGSKLPAADAEPAVGPGMKRVLARHQASVLVVGTRIQYLSVAGQSPNKTAKVLAESKYVILRMDDVAGSKHYLSARTEFRPSSHQTATDAKLAVMFMVSAHGIGAIWMSERIEHNVCNPADPPCTKPVIKFYYTELPKHVDMSQPDLISVTAYHQQAMSTIAAKKH